MAVPGAKARYSYLYDITRNPEQLMPVDTLMGRTIHFDSLYLRNLGSEGTPAFDLLWNPFVSPGFRYGFHQWDEYRLTAGKVRYFNTQNPYSNLFYSQGAENTQRVEVLHTQNLVPNWNGAVHLNRQAAGGWYGQQGTSMSNFGVNTWYRSPNRRYMALASATFNTLDAEENGGIKNLTTFDTVDAADRRRIATWLTDAKQRWKDHEYNLQQFVYFGTKTEQKINDTLTAGILKPRFYLSHGIRYSKFRYTYTDRNPDSGFYGKVLFDASKISDEYIEQKLINRIAIGYTKPDTQRNRIYFIQGYAEHEYVKGNMKTEEFVYADNTRLGFDGTASGKAGLSASGYIYLTGFNAGNYSLQGDIQIPFIAKLGITHIYALGGVQGYSPSYIQQRFISGQAIWGNNFRQTNVVQAGGGLKGKGNAKLEAVYQIGDGLVYFGKDFRPVQADTATHYVRFTLQKLLKLGNFYFDHSITYQKVLRGEGVRVPDFIWRSSYYYQTRLFKTLTFRAGVDGNYRSAYYPFSYRPGLSNFYRQDTLKLGNYPVLDAWISGQVKSLQFFFKMDHTNFDLSSNDYFNLPAYPMYPRTYRLGLRWWFYN